jgi:hypothetical protein
MATLHFSWEKKPWVMADTRNSYVSLEKENTCYLKKNVDL